MRSKQSSSSMFVDVSFCIRHSYLFFILLFSSVVFLLSLTLLFSVQLKLKGLQVKFIGTLPITVSYLILSVRSRSSSSEDLRPTTLFHKDTAIHSQTLVTRNPTSHSGRLCLGSALTHTFSQLTSKSGLVRPNLP